MELWQLLVGALALGALFLWQSAGKAGAVLQERDDWHRRYLDHAPATSTPMTDLREAIQILADLLNERTPR